VVAGLLYLNGRRGNREKPCGREWPPREIRRDLQEGMAAEKTGEEFAGTIRARYQTEKRKIWRLL
jgi:hypothetical protein